MLGHLLTNQYIIDESELVLAYPDDEDCDETICALCGQTPTECPCYHHPPHDCRVHGCLRGEVYPCSAIKICQCLLDA